MSFIIHDLQFEITKALYWGNLRDDGLHWAISIQGGANTELGFSLEPRAYSDRIFGFDSDTPKTFNSWINREVSWDACYNDELGSHNAAMYGFEHCEIYKAILRMVATPYKKACIRWDGRCDLCIDHRYDRNLRFSIQAELAFAGIRVGLKQPSKARETLSYWITDVDFKRLYLTEAGRQLSGLVFEPVENSDHP